MANTKISGLTTATTPLDGTEVLPIVQSGSTVKVANNDLRPKQIQSNSTSGIMQISGPSSSATRVMTIPDANFTAARTDSTQTFTGDQTISNGVLTVTKNGVSQIQLTNTSGTTKNTQMIFADNVGSKWRIGMDVATNNNTVNFQLYSDVGSASYLTMSSNGNLSLDVGNLVQGAAAKGINFTANTPASGMTSQLLNWYEEGTFTPQIADAASGGNSASFSGSGRYTRIGRQVTIQFQSDSITTTGMTGSNAVYFRNFPFTSNSANSALGSFYTYRVGGGAAQSASVYMGGSVTYANIFIYTGISLTTDTPLIVSNLVSGISSVYFSLTYFV
jgi:hypothetical protein